jgi:hypothetical protein
MKPYVYFVIFCSLFILCGLVIAEELGNEAKTVITKYNISIKVSEVTLCEKIPYEFTRYKSEIAYYECPKEIEKNQTLDANGSCTRILQVQELVKASYDECKYDGFIPDKTGIKVNVSNPTDGCFVTDSTICCWDYNDGYSANRAVEFRSKCRSGESCACWNITSMTKTMDMGSSFNEVKI